MEHICRRLLLVKFFAYLTFGGIVCYNLYKKIVRKAFAMRLDKFVSSQRNDISRSMVRELCRKGQVTVNGKVAKAADAKVSENDIVAVKGVEICYKDEQAAGCGLLHS